MLTAQITLGGLGVLFIALLVAECVNEHRKEK